MCHHLNNDGDLKNQKQQNSLYNLSKYQRVKQQPAAVRGGGRQRRPLLTCLATTLALTLLFSGKVAYAAEDSVDTPINQNDGGDAGTKPPSGSNYYTQDSQQYQKSYIPSPGEKPSIHIDAIEPEAGPTTGETRVLVRGPFAQFQYVYPKPMCKFGHDDMVVEATYVLCTAQPHNLLEREARHRDKNETCLQCDNSPASAKAEIVPFTVSLTGDFSDVSNSLSFRYYPPTRVFAIYPRYGPKDGETVVQVWGENFLNYDENTRCAFGTKSVVATFISSNYMICVSPFSDVVEKPIPFTVSLNNQQNSKDSLFFWYYSFPAITDLIPDRGPDTGGTKVLLRGRNFNPFRDETQINNANDTFCWFENLGKVPAQVINSTKAICISPPSYVLRQAVVEISLNNQQYTDDNNIFYYYRPPYLFDTNPREGPVKGGTKVICVGSNFRDTKNITCKFNETVVPGKYISQSEIECIAPPSQRSGFVPLSISMELDMYSPALQYLYYDNPVIDSIYPICGPEYGFTQITVKGSNFVDMGHDKVLCVFNKTIFTNATIMDFETIKCDSPPILNSLGYSQISYHTLWYNLEITVDGGREIAGPAQKFSYYQDPKIFDIQPSSGPITGGTQVKVIGKGFNQEAACNKTLRFSVFETKPTTQTTDNVTEVLSPPASVPDAVVVALALNGQQFTKDLTLHVKDPENTFEYYNIPIITSYFPKSGPSIGGTKMIINGIGFTPRRENSKDPKERINKLWVRFVDPDSKKELAPIQQVKTEDLYNDQIIWYTPALYADTKALMQISLNKQNWHNVLLDKKPYSFSYYDSPHISYVDPSYGPVKHKEELFMEIHGSNFKCSDAKCEDLQVRFGEPDQAIYVKGIWVSDSVVKVRVPKYTKPDVLRVELTVNGQDWTNDGKSYGYFDPFVLRAEPTLISVDGTTKVRVKGFGYVNTKTSKVLFSSQGNYSLVCQGKACIKDAVYIDKNTLETATFPQAIVNYKETEQNVLWDPINIDASLIGETEFTDNSVQVFYYEDPDYKELSIDESPANIETQIFVTADFKKNPIERLLKYANATCRFRGDDGQVKITQGQLRRYPLERGSPNSVNCKSPIWDLKGRAYETTKLDISINGQDYKGNFEFIFSQDIMIHRSVPMSGPSQAGFKTRILGSGFRPLRTNVDAKWGIFQTSIIPKSQVEDYIYQQYAFENMIEGSEELKGYIYEASIFHRVDSHMIEDHKYHSVYMNSAKFDQWAVTEGGPIYVEVGRDINMKYIGRENVTISENQTVNNQTSLITYTQEQNVVKSWVYYEYEPSSVEYYYYKDCIIKDMLPHSGIITGGTQIAVAGAWMKYMPEYGVVPHCKFGDKIVRAHFDSTVRIVCKAPPGEELGKVMPFEVSLNGVDWTDSGLTFFYYDVPVMHGIEPIMGPEAGGTMIYIKGAKFSNISNPQEFHCKFTPVNLPIPPKKMPGIYLNQSTIMCAAPGGWGQGVAVKLQVTFNGGDYDDNGFIFTFFSITRAFPRSGPSDGQGGEIVIDGFGFRNDTKVLCRINNTIYEPISVNWKQIKCPMPKAQGGESFFGNVDLAVSANGNDWHEFVGGFQYYPQPVVEDIFPKQGPSLGVGIINFYGSGFRNDYNLVDMACKIGESVGKAVYVSPQHVKCVVEDMDLVNEGEYLPAQLALNRYSWTALGNSTFYLPYGVEQIFPNSGPTSGVTDVIIQGKGFVDEEEKGVARCRFGTPANFAIVEAQILSYERLVCKAPSDYKPSPPGTLPEDVPVSIALTTDENDPWTETSHKFRFYQQPILASCDPCEADVGQIREIYLWADEGSQFFEPLPSVHHANIEEEDEEKGISLSMAGQFGGITCQFGRFGETQAIYINSTVIKCITPAVEDDPDSIYRETVTLTVAMNGVDHEESTSDIEFTFVGTGTYFQLWPFLIGVLLLSLLVVAIVLCSATIFQKISIQDYIQSRRGPSSAQGEKAPHVINLGGGVMVPRGRSDWHAERSSVDIIERVSGQQFYS